MAKQLIDSLTSDFDPEQVPRRVPRGAAGADRAQGARARSVVERRLRGAHADQGARPDGRARGEPRGRQAASRWQAAKRRSTARRKKPKASTASEAARPLEDLEVQAAIAKQGQGREVEVDGRAARADQPRQGALARGRLHQGRGDRLLRAHRGRDAPAPPRPPADAACASPNGVDGQRFFEKRCPKHRPTGCRPRRLSVAQRGLHRLLRCDDAATLVWLAQLAALELHPSLSLAEGLERPTVARVRPRPRPAGRHRRVLPGRRCGCASCSATSVSSASQDLRVEGPPGLCPAEHARSPTSKTKPFARAVAQLLEKADAGQVVSQMAKELRKGKVLVDWSQNDEHKTTVAVYSLRARERPTVSTPSVGGGRARAQRREDPDLLRFEAADVLKRVEKPATCSPRCSSCTQRLPASRRARTRRRREPSERLADDRLARWPRPRRGAGPASCRAPLGAISGSSSASARICVERLGELRRATPASRSRWARPSAPRRRAAGSRSSAGGSRSRAGAWRRRGS